MRIAILGNSGSGKTTLARRLAEVPDTAVLDLDTIVWEPDRIAVRRASEAIGADLHAFCSGHTDWIVEGCYGDLVESALRWRPELVFMNPGVDACIANCRNRPWEPHKYASKVEQDERLEFLLTWVAGYYERDDEMSLRRHRNVFDAYDGPKREVLRNEDLVAD